jgi:predicted thioredoxin/glutaredoxin
MIDFIKELYWIKEQPIFLHLLDEECDESDDDHWMFDMEVIL